MKTPKAWFLNPRLCWVVLLTFGCLSLVPANGHAGLIGSRTAVGALAAERSDQIETVRQALEKEVVAQRLADYGLTPAEVEAKLPELSDAQLHQLAGLSENIAGGNAIEGLIAVLLIAFLVVVIVKLLDKEIIIR